MVSQRRIQVVGHQATGAPTLIPLGFLEDLEKHPWKAESLCSQTDPEAFFPDKGGSTREAKAVCGRCPVSAECLEYALANQERYGIWGGHSERERRKLIRRREREAS